MLYRILPDHANYLMQTFSEDYMLESITMEKGVVADPRPHVFGSEWKEIEILFADAYPENKKQKVIPDITIEGGRLILTEQAANTLEPFLSDGELLPVNYNDKKWYIFNPLKIIEPNTLLSTRDQFGDVTSLVFDKEEFLFKSEYEGYSGVFCNQEFKDAVIKNGLKGVGFNVDLANIFLDDGTSCKPTAH